MFKLFALGKIYIFLHCVTVNVTEFWQQYTFWRFTVFHMKKSGDIDRLHS